MRTNSHLAEISRGENRELTAGKRGLPIARSLYCEIESQFHFRLHEREERSRMTLDMLPKNRLARVIGVESDAGHTLRLMEMGLVPGAAVRMVKTAPLGDPIQVCVRNYDLALRRAEAKSIVVALDEK